MLASLLLKTKQPKTKTETKKLNCCFQKLSQTARHKDGNVYVPIILQLMYHLTLEIQTQMPHLFTAGLMTQNQNVSKCINLMTCSSQLLQI